MAKPLPSTEARILSRLTQASATLEDLRTITALSASGVKSSISRLRDKQFKIFSESTAVSGDPRYTLASGPGSLGANFLCPSCSNTIRLGHVSDHAPSCPFGPGALP